MNHFSKLIICATAAFMFAGCQKTVKTSVPASYVIKGNPESVLYPLEVKQNNEDVFILLKETAPLPAIVSIDAAGQEVAFNFTQLGQTLIVPAKFEHLRLRHEGSESTDILKTAAK